LSVAFFLTLVVFVPVLNVISMRTFSFRERFSAFSAGLVSLNLTRLVLPAAIVPLALPIGLAAAAVAVTLRGPKTCSE
jgi:hypothetical protein